jgi:hypothetical protein
MLTISTIAIIQDIMSFELAGAVVIIGVVVANVFLPVDINKTIQNITGAKKNDE